MTQSANLKHFGHLGADAGWQHGSSQGAQHSLHASVKNRCPGIAGVVGEAQSTLLYSPIPQHCPAYTFPEPEQCLYLRTLNVVLFLLSLLHP